MSEAERGDCKAEERDGCPSEVAVLQRFWRNTKRNIERQKEEAKPCDGDWWRGYEAALHWISHEAFNANVVEFPKKAPNARELNGSDAAKHG